MTTSCLLEENLPEGLLGDENPARWLVVLGDAGAP